MVSMKSLENETVARLTQCARFEGEERVLIFLIFWLSVCASYAYWYIRRSSVRFLRPGPSFVSSDVCRPLQ
jgi:hypothetical protein